VSDHIDHQRVLAEIDEEVRRRRDAGDIPVDLERELDALFARHIPAMSFEATFDQVLDRVEGAAIIDTAAPTTSARPGVPALKKTIQRSVLWMFDHLARQVTSFAEASTRALRLLDERVEALEQAVAVATPFDAGVGAMRVDPHWAAALPGLLEGVNGRIAVLDAGEGALVAALVAGGADAYGVEPDPAAAQVGAGAGLEIRVDDSASHLRRVDDDTLGAAVLVGCVDYLPANAKLTLTQLAARKVRPGGRVVILGSDPAAWAAANPVAADLAPGHPFHHETWERVLGDFGLETSVTNGPGSYAVLARR
jgi:SAM-dependent methyltransferase